MLYAHLKPEILNQLHKTILGDILPHPLPVHDLGWHCISQGAMLIDFYNFELQINPISYKWGFSLDNSRLTEEALTALNSYYWHKASWQELTTERFIPCSAIHHLSI